MRLKPNELGCDTEFTVCSKKWEGPVLEVIILENDHFLWSERRFQSSITFFLDVVWRWLIYEKCCQLSELFEKQHRGTQKMTRTPYITLWSHIVNFRSQSNITFGRLIFDGGPFCGVSGRRNSWIWSIFKDPSEQIFEKTF